MERELYGCEDDEDWRAVHPYMSREEYATAHAEDDSKDEDEDDSEDGDEDDSDEDSDDEEDDEEEEDPKSTEFIIKLRLLRAP